MNKSSPTKIHKRTLAVIDDDRFFCDTVRAALDEFNLTIVSAHNAADGLRQCSNQPVDVVLLDQKLPDGGGIDLCGRLFALNESSKIIFITAFPSFENAVQAIKVGACDYLSKPFDMGELRLAVGQALRTLELEHLEQVRHLVDLAAANDAAVLLTGETGTGKSLVAKRIHFQGGAARSSFISVNCAAIPENLIEAELFGHEKGAFTGAERTAKGLFEMADGGTLFLDEIGDMPIQLQSKLLGVLDDQRIRRLGGQVYIPVNVRIIAATNADLAERVEKRRFREDLYYRLSVLHIHVPPLRERPDDIADLCRHFLDKIAPDQQIRLDEVQLDALRNYPWPGNVRELRNIIERAILLRSGSEIQPAAMLIQHRPNIPGPVGKPTAPSVASLAQVEQAHIQQMLRHFNGNQTHAAKALGISRSTLVRKIKTHRI
ncbi:MAG: sigma-54-dependent Fis family transcriptional regulator [Desulfatitalea sp.]|nr:sigma-54 dependent transcriptional regulator [Desulfatitalea sp.]NNJ99792.1 sigma-54-dependent Fis family transcriptional regulator [Desulfatitalea sp.]